jgi:gas vesicle protein
MRSRDNTDVWAAVAIGAIVGIGAALLVRARQEDETHELVKRLRPMGRRAGRTASAVRKEVGRRTSSAGDELAEAGREIMEELRRSARQIVANTRDELERTARDSVVEARKAAQKAARRALR